MRSEFEFSVRLLVLTNFVYASSRFVFTFFKDVFTPISPGVVSRVGPRGWIYARGDRVFETRNSSVSADSGSRLLIYSYFFVFLIISSYPFLVLIISSGFLLCTTAPAQHRTNTCFFVFLRISSYFLLSLPMYSSSDFFLCTSTPEHHRTSTDFC